MFRSIISHVQKFAEKTGFVESQDVAEMRGHWLAVFKFFHDVQKASDELQLLRLHTQLPAVENHLNEMVKLLIRERNAFVVSVDDGAAELPPCYEYLLRDSGTSTSSSGGGGGGGGGSSSSSSGAGGGGGGATGSAASVACGRDIITNVCQYAKHNQPHGARAVALRFLTRLFGEVDTNSGHKSLFHFSSDFVAMPVVDVLRVTAAKLHPWMRAGAHEGGIDDRTGSGSGTSLSAADERFELVRFATCIARQIERIPSIASFFIVDASTAVAASLRVAFSPLHRQQQQQHPHSGRERRTVVDASAADTGDDAGGRQWEEVDRHRDGDDATTLLAERHALLVLDVLVPYIKDHLASAADIPEARRLECIANALRGILHIAKCRDRVISAMVRSNCDIRDLAISEVTRTLVTVCKVPSNSSFRFQFDYVREVFRFFDALLTLLPHIARGFSLHAELAEKVVRDTLLKLLLADKEQVFVTAALMTAELLKMLEGDEARTVVANPLSCDAKLVNRLLANIANPSDDVAHATLLLLLALVEHAPSIALRELLGVDPQQLAELAARMADLERPPHQGPSCAELPRSDISAIFPPELRVDYVCGSNSVVFNVEVQRTLLRIEGRLFADDQKAVARKRFLLHRAQQPHSPFIASRSFLPQVANAPLVVALAQHMRATLLERGFAVAACFTKLIVAMCALPEVAVGYTLFHEPAPREVLAVAAGAAGPLRAAMKDISAHIARMMNDDDHITSATGSGSGGGGSSASMTHTSRRSVYQHCTRRPFFQEEGVDLSGAPEFATHRAFVNSCIVVEGLRHELATLFALLEVAEQWERMTANEPDHQCAEE